MSLVKVGKLLIYADDVQLLYANKAKEVNYLSSTVQRDMEKLRYIVANGGNVLRAYFDNILIINKEMRCLLNNFNDVKCKTHAYIYEHVPGDMP